MPVPALTRPHQTAAAPWLRAVAATLFGLFATSLAACPDDSGNPGSDTCQSGGGIACEEIPQIDTVPADRRIEVVDAAMAKGDSVTRAVRVINVGRAPLDLRNVVLEYTAPSGAKDGDKPAFRLLPLPVNLPFAIQIFGSDNYPQAVDILVEYTKGDDALAREAKLVITSNDPLVPDKKIEVLFTTAVGAPRLAVQENPVDFGLVPNGQRRERPLTMLNTGTRGLKVTGFKISKDGRFGFKGDGFEAEGVDAFELVDLETPIEIPAGEGRPITVTFFSDSPLPANGELLIFSDDPVSGQNGLVVNLVANKNGPCISVNPTKINFRGKEVGKVSVIDFEIESCGTEPLKITDLVFKENSSPDFTFDFTRLPAGFEDGPNPSNALTIPINTKVTVGVIFVPDSVNPRTAENIPIPDEGIVVVSSNGFNSEVEVPVSGSGAEAECPTAVIQVQEGEEVIPQTVVHLSGTGSYAPFGAITRWQWSITRPDGAPAVLFVPSFTDPTPVVELNSVGLYTLKLNVRDEFGNSSGSGACPDAVYEILVQPDQAIHIELTWVTPGDLDETDTGTGKGADLDLHFAHQDARGPDLDKDGQPDPWFDKQWDAFWYNRKPDWATMGQDRDDPSLDRDDTDGAGPENLNLSVPQDNVTYKIGVHYWDDHGFGISNATVKVFHYADLIYEVTQNGMQDRDMWCVGKINWPVPAVLRCAADGAPEFITPMYVNSFFQPF